MFPAIDVAKLTTLLNTEILNDPVKTPAYNASQTKTLLTTLQTAPYPTAATVRTAITALPGAEQVTYRRLVKFIREFYPGVDETVAGRVTYRGFNFRTNGAALLTRAQDAWALMGKLTATMVRYLGHVRSPAAMALGSYGAGSAEKTKANDLFVRWFDRQRASASIDEVRRVVTNLHNAVTAQDFEIICEGDPVDQHGLCYPNPIAPGEFGEVRSGDARNRFYLGPVFFDALQQHMGGACSLSVMPRVGQTWAQARAAIFTALNASTITMLHELTHITAIGGTTDNAPNPYSVAACLAKARDTPNLAIANAENYALYAKDILTEMQFRPPAPVRI